MEIKLKAEFTDLDRTQDKLIITSSDDGSSTVLISFESTSHAVRRVGLYDLFFAFTALSEINKQ